MNGIQSPPINPPLYAFKLMIGGRSFISYHSIRFLLALDLPLPLFRLRSYKAGVLAPVRIGETQPRSNAWIFSNTTSIKNFSA